MTDPSHTEHEQKITRESALGNKKSESGLKKVSV